MTAFDNAYGLGFVPDSPPDLDGGLRTPEQLSPVALDAFDNLGPVPDLPPDLDGGYRSPEQLSPVDEKDLEWEVDVPDPVAPNPVSPPRRDKVDVIILKMLRELGATNPPSDHQVEVVVDTLWDMVDRDGAVPGPFNAPTIWAQHGRGVEQTVNSIKSVLLGA